MLNCRTCQQLLVESLYESPNQTDHRNIVSHIKTCESCRELADELELSKDFINRFSFKNESVNPQAITELDSLWSRLEPELDRIDASRVTQLTESRNRWRNLTAVMAMAACVILVSGISLLLVNPSNDIEDIPAQLAGVDSSSDDFNRYLSRAQPVLLAIANEDGIDGFIPVDQGYAEIMALEAELLVDGHQTKLSTSQQRLLKDVQFLLTQYASLEQGDMESGLEVLQFLLGNNTVLFRMNLAEMRNEIPVI